MRLATFVSATIKFSRTVVKLPGRTLHTITTRVSTVTRDLSLSPPATSTRPFSTTSYLKKHLQISESSTVQLCSPQEISGEAQAARINKTLLEPNEAVSSESHPFNTKPFNNEYEVCYNFGMLEPAIFHRKQFSMEAFRYYFLSTGALENYYLKHDRLAPPRPLSPFDRNWKSMFFQRGDHLNDIALGLNFPSGIFSAIGSDANATLKEFSKTHDTKIYSEFHKDLGYFLGYPGFVNPNGVVYKTADLQPSFVISAMMKAVLDHRKIKFSLEGINPEHLDQKPSYHPEFHGSQPINIMTHLQQNYADIPRVTFTLFELANVLSFIPFYMHCEFYQNATDQQPLSMQQLMNAGLHLRHPHLYQLPAMMLRQTLGHHDSHRLIHDYKSQYVKALECLKNNNSFDLFSFVPDTEHHLSAADKKFIPLPLSFTSTKLASN
ncbi:hypothetical protein [Pelagibaculum spongiae]|uniref:Uncharacterized protein n=1 Tax=Pelagibaculum spongiae TaxID=2080658 RepID=A0A2V1H0R3_9GAMM|nr:hypothetical protein [Pelagibaculum spongiae]PVZ68889.1 hypothetical protein DC094_11595 [Pelagibaculum spongiae]